MSDADFVWALAGALNAALLYGSVLIALGSLLLLAWTPWPASQRATVVVQGRLAALGVLVAIVLALGIGGAAATAGTDTPPWDPAAWAIAARSSLGRSALYGGAGAVLGWWALATRSALFQQTAGALLVGSLVVTGHAATASPVRVMASSVALHVIAAGYWSAALWPLAAALRRLPAPESARLCDAFAARAVGMLIMLIVSGLVLMLVQVGTVHNLITTPYGIRLALKLALVAGLLGLAARNNFTLTPSLQRGEAGAAASLRRSALVELALMALVTLLAASLTMTDPPGHDSPG